MLTRNQLLELRKARPVTGASPSRIRKAIELADTTQVEVAAAVGVAQSQVSEDASGNFTEMSLDKARAYAQFFGCDVDDLFPSRQAVAS